MKALEDVTEAAACGGAAVCKRCLVGCRYRQAGPELFLPTHRDHSTPSHLSLNFKVNAPAINYKSSCCCSRPRKATCVTVLPSPYTSRPTLPLGSKSPKLSTEVSVAFCAPPPCDLKDSLPLF